jgi:hypothetical protein
MLQVTTSQESRLNVKKVFFKSMFFWGEMPYRTCELAGALITNVYAICKYEYNC